MLRVILVRHGQTESNNKGAYLGWTDVPLNSIGISQAISVKDRLKDIKADKIFCSPLKRTIETAEIINHNYNKELIFEDALKEINFGLWDNLTYNEIEEKFTEKHKEWLNGGSSFVFPEGESADEAFERHKTFIMKLMGEINEGTVIIVSHGGFIRNAIAILLDLKQEDSWHFKIDNGSICELQIDNGYGILTSLNG